MPIEIRELVIRATVGDQNGRSPTPPEQSQSAKDEIVNEAVERVLEVLRRMKER